MGSREVFTLRKVQKLSETEMEVMQAIWESTSPITSKELLKLFSQKGKEWKAQTISTFLSRLVNKGLLTISKQGRHNIYTSRLSYDEYKKWEAQSMLNKMYQGSIRNFLSTLYDGEKVPQKDINELKQWFSEK